MSRRWQPRTTAITRELHYTTQNHCKKNVPPEKQRIRGKPTTMSARSTPWVAFVANSPKKKIANKRERIRTIPDVVVDNQVGSTCTLLIYSTSPIIFGFEIYVIRFSTGHVNEASTDGGGLGRRWCPGGQRPGLYFSTECVKGSGVERANAMSVSKLATSRMCKST